MTISIAVALLILISLAAFFAFKTKRFFYPVAPPMPAEVTKPVTEILSQLESILKAKAPQVLEAMQPGLSEEQIAALEQKDGIMIPDDIKALYKWHNGCRISDVNGSNYLIDGPIPAHRFMPLDEAMATAQSMRREVAEAPMLQRIFFNVFAGHRKNWICLFDDGCGDGYFYDPERKPVDGSVFYCFAEVNNYVFFPSVNNLMAGIVKCYEEDAFTWKGGKDNVRLVEDFERAAKIWQEFGVDSESQKWRQ